MQNENDSREFTRTLIRAEADICSDQKKIHGQITDLSLRGLFLHCRDHFPEKTVCSIDIYLEEQELHIYAKGRIARTLEDGLAVEFTEIELDSFEHLRSLVRIHAVNVSQVEGEFKTHLGLKRPKEI